MKNLVYALVGAGFMIACQPSSRPEISGTLTGIESDTLLVQSFPVNDRDSRRTDTVAMQNGSFAFNLGNSVLKQVYIYGKPSVKPNEDGSIPAISMKAVSFLLLPGQPIKISGSLDEYKLEGGSFYDDYTEVMEDCKTYSHKIDSLNVVCMPSTSPASSTACLILMAAWPTPSRWNGPLPTAATGWLSS